MNWFRAHRRGGSRLALVALVLQVVLTFGHVHGLADPATPGATDAAIADTASGHAPSNQPAPTDHDGDDCAICATLAMAHSGLTVVPPHLPLPSTHPSVVRRADNAQPEAARAAPAFQPRAPPAA